MFMDAESYPYPDSNPNPIPSEQKKMLEEQPVQRKKSEGNVFVHTYLLNKQHYEYLILNKKSVTMQLPVRNVLGMWIQNEYSFY